MTKLLTDKPINTYPDRQGIDAGDFISSADMNACLDALGERTNYLYTMGIYPHKTTYTYPAGAFCQDSEVVYRATVANTGKPPASNPSIWAACPMTAAEIAADRPFESTVANIKMDGTQAVGTLNTVARGDHVHPTDTSRVAKAGDTMTGQLTFKGGTLEAGGGFNSSADNDSGMDFPADGHVRLRSNARVAVEALSDGTVKTWYGGNNIACQPNGHMVVYDTNGAAKHVFRGNGSYTAFGNIESQANIYGREVIAKQTAIICNRNNESQQWHIYSDNDRDLKFHSTVAGGTVGYINREGKIYTTGYGWLHDKFAPLASPALTGTPTAPTAAYGTNNTQIANTAFVQNELNSRAPLSSSASLYATNNTSQLSVTIVAPRSGVIVMSGSKNVSSYSGLTGYPLDMYLNGSAVSSDNCTHSISNQVALPVVAGTHTVLLEGAHVSSYSLWLSATFIPN